MRRTSLSPRNVKGNNYFLSVDENFSKFEQPPHLQMPFARLIGPLNGVYLVVPEDWPGPAGLLNPSRRQFKPLPLFEHEGLPERRKEERRGIFYLHGFDYGLGLDPETGDFKLVLMSLRLKLAAVCGSDNDYDSWRFLDGVKPRSDVWSCRSTNTYLNGVYYWLLYYFRSGDVAVLAFDMRTEEFKEIQVKSCDTKNWRWGLLDLSGDSLVLVAKCLEKRSISVWKMLKEGCWIRSAMVVVPEIYCNIHPLYFWKNDELLLQVELLEGGNVYLITYNVRSQKLGGPVFTRRAEFARLYGYPKYEESLASFKGNYMLWDPSSDYIKDLFEQVREEL